MKSPIDWCRFFADIEKDPTAVVPPLTIGQLIRAKEHGETCDVCSLRIERTLAKFPDSVPIKTNLN